jgi:predicted Zn-dependent protease
MCLSPGHSSREKMIQSVKRGVLVTRFHYVRGQSDVPDDILTGMTRDGTFLIEDGELTKGIKNLRFTDSVMRTFSSCKAISRSLTLVHPEFAGMATLAPTLHLGSFRFTGKTDF